MVNFSAQAAATEGIRPNPPPRASHTTRSRLTSLLHGVPGCSGRARALFVGATSVATGTSPGP